MGANSQLIGAAGEYAVASELSHRGWVATVTLQNAAGIDVLAAKDGVSRHIQVKANETGRRDWVLSKKSEAPDAEFFAFVAFRGLGERPDFFIVPARVVARCTRWSHRQWLRAPGISGQDHNDNSMRKWRDRRARYLERWDLL